ncbi:MAG: Holo-[acyl-carrier-protein] synthase [bacterium]|nr:Holo-[acyl-carrier-protein] synthase [bacterium]
MICGLGIDLVEIVRIEELLARWPQRFVQRVFTPEEIALCESRTHRAAAFAARFAAKEALAKALGTGMDRHLAWKDFAVLNHSNGRPMPVLSPRLAARLAGLKVHLSLSHTDHAATAVVILEGHD